MGQLGFFDLSRRYEGLDVKDDPLVAIVAVGILAAEAEGIADHRRASGERRGAQESGRAQAMG